MVSLKIKFSALAIVILLQFSVAAGQTAKEIKNAFKESYAIEKTGDYKKAANTIKSVYVSNSYEINLRLGWLEYNAGLFTESAAYYNKAVNIHPYSEEAKFGLINTKVAQGKWNEVIILYGRILDVSPSNYTANYRLGLIYYGKKDYAKAYKLFEKAVNLYPFTYDALIMYAWTNYFLGKTREAKILFEKALLAYPDDYSAKQGLGLIK